ncbi:MAG: glycosyltransferase [Caldilineaceae bacterium]
MKIALIGPVHPYRGGIAHYTTLLGQALCERGHELLLISFQRQYPRWLFPGRSDRDPSEQPLMAPDAQYWIDSLKPWTWLTTFGRIRRYAPDLIVLQWWTSFWTPIWLTFVVLNRLKLRRPVVWICHNVLPHEASWLDRYATQLVLRWGQQWIIHSEAEQLKLRQLLPQASSTIVTMPVFPVFRGRIAKTDALAKLHLPAKQKILLFFGIVRPYKGVLDLIQALPQIERVLGAVTLLVAGEFWQEQKQAVMTLIDDLKLNSVVILDDRYIPNEEVPLYFSAADLLVAPYRQVTGSAVIQSALAWGLPIVTTSVVRPTLPPAQVALIAGWATAGDPVTLANAVIACLQGDGLADAPPSPLASVDSWAPVIDLLAQVAGAQPNALPRE